MILDVNLYVSLFKFFEKDGNITWNYSPTSPQYPPWGEESGCCRKVAVMGRAGIGVIWHSFILFFGGGGVCKISFLEKSI